MGTALLLGISIAVMGTTMLFVQFITISVLGATMLQLQLKPKPQLLVISFLFPDTINVLQFKAIVLKNALSLLLKDTILQFQAFVLQDPVSFVLVISIIFTHLQQVPKLQPDAITFLLAHLLSLTVVLSIPVAYLQQVAKLLSKSVNVLRRLLWLL
jgi:hypothetical protein